MYRYILVAHRPRSAEPHTVGVSTVFERLDAAEGRAAVAVANISRGALSDVRAYVIAADGTIRSIVAMEQ